MAKYDCVFCGTATYDLLFLVDKVPSSDQRIKALHKLESGGGPAATAAVALQKLGMKTALISAIGDDDIGKKIYEELKEYNIDLTELKIMPGRISPFSVIHVEKNSGKRAITHYGGCLKFLDPTLINKDILMDTSMIHLDANRFALAIEIAYYTKTKTKAKVSLDGGNISADHLFQILPFVDILIIDEKTIKNAFTFNLLKEVCETFHEKGPETIVVTQGENGLTSYYNKEFIKLPAYPVKAVDTTGAGDNFHGAFLFGYLKGWSLLDNLKFSSAFAALSCTGLGGRNAIPTFEQTRKFISFKEISELKKC
ncbi:MAG TPA: PfkB family carbohydrate kinase [Atribacterota bacterium]|nr:PfkB family carbohydrate kinase [Atribacterota bacterium]